PEEGPGCEGGKVDLDPGHRAAVPDVGRPQVQAGQEDIERCGRSGSRVDLRQRRVDRDDEGQRSRGQPQMRSRGHARDIVADVVTDERSQARMRPANELVGSHGHGASVDPRPRRRLCRKPAAPGNQPRSTTSRVWALRARTCLSWLANAPTTSWRTSRMISASSGAVHEPVAVCSHPRPKGPRPAKRYPKPCAMVETWPVWWASGDRQTMKDRDTLIAAPCPMPRSVIHA